MTEVTESLFCPPSAPDYMSAFDSDWTWYVRGHDEAELWVIDDPALMEAKPLYMAPIRASQAEDYGLSDDGDEDTVTRDPKTGRFAPRWLWVECGPQHEGAVPFLGARYTT